MDLSFFERIFVDDEESSNLIAYFKFIMLYILMASDVLSSQDDSLKRNVLQKAMFVRNFMNNHGMTIMVVFHEVEKFIERLKTCFPEHSEVTELPEIPESGPRLRRMLFPVCMELDELMFPPNSELGTCCNIGRCSYCGKGEHFYSDEYIQGDHTYTCPKCATQRGKPCFICS